MPTFFFLAALCLAQTQTQTPEREGRMPEEKSTSYAPNLEFVRKMGRFTVGANPPLYPSYKEKADKINPRKQC